MSFEDADETHVIAQRRFAENMSLRDLAYPSDSQ
jgi:hypothetical protein